MKTLIHSHSGRPGVFTLRRAKLLLCQHLHKKWRRRVAFSPIEASGYTYEVRCLKCGMRDIEIIEFQKTRMSA
jgi:hypothetical protein